MLARRCQVQPEVRSANLRLSVDRTAGLTAVPTALSSSPLGPTTTSLPNHRSAPATCPPITPGPLVADARETPGLTRMLRALLPTEATSGAPAAPITEAPEHQGAPRRR